MSAANDFMRRMLPTKYPMHTKIIPKLTKQSGSSAGFGICIFAHFAGHQS